MDKSDDLDFRFYNCTLRGLNPLMHRLNMNTLKKIYIPIFECFMNSKG